MGPLKLARRRQLLQGHAHLRANVQRGLVAAGVDEQLPVSGQMRQVGAGAVRPLPRLEGVNEARDRDPGALDGAAQSREAPETKRCGNEGHGALPGVRDRVSELETLIASLLSWIADQGHNQPPLFLLCMEQKTSSEPYS